MRLAGERTIPGGTANFGATLAIETTPIEEWLELEPGITALVTSGHPELSSDLAFKKPFRLSLTAEFMVGLGPFVGRTVNGPAEGTSHGIELVLDFMFWRGKSRGLVPRARLEPNLRQRRAFHQLERRTPLRMALGRHWQGVSA